MLDFCWIVSFDRNIFIGAEFGAWLLDKGAQKTSKFISKHAESMRKGERTDKPLNVDPRVQTGVHYLRKGSKVAVKVSGYVGKYCKDSCITPGAYEK